MDALERLSQIIEDYYTKSKVEKASSLLAELRSGKYYSPSKIRKFLVSHYQTLVPSLGQEEYSIFKQIVISSIPQLIDERNRQKIAYSLLSDMIQYSCLQDDIDIFLAYEKEIKRLVKTNKDKYFYHVVVLAQTKKRILNDISDIEDFFIDKYLTLSRMNSINYGYLICFTSNVSNVDKRKFLVHLMKCRPFRNDFIINSFIFHHEELNKLGTLV